MPTLLRWRQQRQRDPKLRGQQMGRGLEQHQRQHQHQQQEEQKRRQGHRCQHHHQRHQQHQPRHCHLDLEQTLTRISRRRFWKTRTATATARRQLDLALLRPATPAATAAALRLQLPQHRPYRPTRLLPADSLPGGSCRRPRLHLRPQQQPQRGRIRRVDPPSRLQHQRRSQMPMLLAAAKAVVRRRETLPKVVAAATAAEVKL